MARVGLICRISRSPDDPAKYAPDGSGWYRLELPAPYLRAAGHHVVLSDHIRQNTRTGEIDLIDPGGTIHTNLDILIVQRWMADMSAQALFAARWSGQTVICDIDDLFTSITPKNKAYEATHPRFAKESNWRFLIDTFNVANLVTASTPFLAEALSKQTTTPIEVVRNFVDIERWTPREITDSRTPVVGWLGATDYRNGDLETLKPIFDKFIRQSGCTFHHAGAAPESPLAWRQLGLSHSRRGTVSPRAVAPELPRMYSTFEVGMVPLADIPFNHAKSWLKSLEMAAAGIPHVAQDLPEQRALGAGLMASEPIDWRKGLHRLRDPAARKEYAAAGRAIAEQHSIAANAWRWLEIIEGV